MWPQSGPVVAVHGLHDCYRGRSGAMFGVPSWNGDGACQLRGRGGDRVAGAVRGGRGEHRLERREEEEAGGGARGEAEADKGRGLSL